MKALYVGTFDPFTLGHLDVLLRARRVFDSVVVGVAEDCGKNAVSSFVRKEIVLASIGQDLGGVSVEVFSGLTSDFALRTGCGVIVRGVRGLLDYENERGLSKVYYDLAGIETFALFSRGECEHISSSNVRELVRLGANIDKYVCKNAKEIILKHY